MRVALVHGAGTAGSSWAPVRERLEAHGHACVAPDLPMDDPEATFADFAGVVADALGAGAEPVLLVGHSMGGMVVPLVAARLGATVHACAYVAAMLPVPGRSLAEVMRAEPMVSPEASAAMVRGADGLIRWDPAAADALLFDELDPPRRAAARAGLRPHAAAPYREPCPLAALPAVPSTAIVCVADRVISPAWGRSAARERLGVTAVELPGGHMPQLARPQALTDLLLAVAA